jgi:RNA polymerase sigma factor (TIGR02999 family)
VRLADAKVEWQDRAHFFALAARTMRRVLVDHATARHAKKRGGGDLKVTLDEAMVAGDTVDLDLLDLEKPLNALADLDPRKAELMEMKLFGGLSFEEMSEVSGLSTPTIDREIRFSKAWLKSRLGSTDPA